MIRLILALVVMAAGGFAGGYLLGRHDGRVDAISHYGKRIRWLRERANDMEWAMGGSHPRLTSAVIKPTASPRSQVELDDDYR